MFFAGTMSVLTLLVQGTTMPAMLALLGVTKKTPVQIQHLLMAAKEVEEYADRNLSHLRVRPSPPARVCAISLVYAVAVRCNPERFLRLHSHSHQHMTGLAHRLGLDVSMCAFARVMC